jgi:hypothetical protein
LLKMRYYWVYIDHIARAVKLGKFWKKL